MNKIGVIVIMLIGIVACQDEQLSQQDGTFAFDSYAASFELGYDEPSRIVKFPFANNSNEPVEIVKIAAKCGCTLVKAEQRIYEPGETGSIDVEFKPYALYGKVSKGVLVSLKSPGEEPKAVELKIHAQVPIAYKLDRTVLKWSALEVGGEYTVRVEKSAQYTVTFTHMEYNEQVFDARLDQDAESATIVLKQIGLPAIDKKLEYITLYTDNELERYKTSNIKCSFLGKKTVELNEERYRLTQDSLLWEKGDVTQQEFYFVSYNQSLSVERVSMLNGSFDVSYEPMGDGQRYKIYAKPAGQDMSKMSVAVLQIHTDAKQIKNKVINYNLIVMP